MKDACLPLLNNITSEYTVLDQKNDYMPPIPFVKAIVSHYGQ